ncbi:TPA: ABC transporter substrate-binding protein [Serratia marcescens]|nr:ABC transporter substrate-binding protein [Serratia marcescens]HEJ9020925.1 ABC transporter substrate-binding protein [Serratia marcescens]HEJ9028098.1 ABC transporter substrate-binding protein [Serratia marcescens]HEJ9039902.1 ABC transporter substrate-binding protein [Serratia marcescens]HEJ9086842.1 ABC transporter substrate-binding protein [Serratia marcescens]
MKPSCRSGSDGVKRRLALLLCALGLGGGAPLRADAVSLQNCGVTHDYPQPPQRVLVYANPALENLLALGLAGRAIGVVGYDRARDPAPTDDALQAPTSPAPPTAEALLLMRPDFVYSASYYWLHSPETPDRALLAAWGIGTYLSPGACSGQQSAIAAALTFEDIFTELRELARIFNVSRAGEVLVERLRGQLRALEPQRAQLPHLRLLWWYAGAQTPYVAGCCGAPGLLSRSVGSENLFGDRPELWPTVSWEVIAARDPDAIVLGDLPRGGLGDSAADKIAFLEHHPLTATLRAVRQRRYVILPGYDMDPSARTVAALGRLIRGLAALPPQAPTFSNKEP